MGIQGDQGWIARSYSPTCHESCIRLGLATTEKSPSETKPNRKLGPVWRGLVEVGFIIFLYYSNLLMGEFEGSEPGSTRGLLWALGDIFTKANLTIAVVTALAGYVVIEFLRERF